MKGILVVLCVCLMTGCATRHRMVESYRGDGQIRYLKKPWVFGFDGFEIQFPEIRLSEPFSASYRMHGVPGEDVTDFTCYVGFVVTNPVARGALTDAELSMTLVEDDRQLWSFSAPCSRWQCASGGGRLKYYWGPWRLQDPSDWSSFSARTDCYYLLSVAYTPDEKAQRLNETGFFYVRCGGYFK